MCRCLIVLQRLRVNMPVVIQQLLRNVILSYAAWQQVHDVTRGADKRFHVSTPTPPARYWFQPKTAIQQVKDPAKQQL